MRYNNNLHAIVSSSIMALRLVYLGVFVCGFSVSIGGFASICYAIDLGFGIVLQDSLPKLECSINTHSCKMNIHSSANDNK